MTSGRGTVTFLLTDVPGSAALWERDPEGTAAAMTALDDAVVVAVSGADGELVKPRGEGDSHFCVFDDPAAALRAALALAPELHGRGAVRIRAALTTGAAEFRDGDWFGPVVNHCARLRAAAAVGQVVVGETTAVAVSIDAVAPGATLADLGWHWLKDLDRPLRAFELRHPSLPSGFPPLASLGPPAPNLRLPLDRFHGRLAERTALRAALSEPGLVTVTGAPGVGKSRLATEVAGDVGRSGTLLVRTVDAAELASVGDDPIPTLLVVDDADHHLGAVASWWEGLGATDRRVLVTARAPTGAPGERVLRLSPLPERDAAELLADRGRADRPALGIDPADPRIADIVDALGRLPLTIELAAARLAVLTPEQLLRRLPDPLRLLAGDRPLDRHRSWAAAVRWSLDTADSDLSESVRRAAVAGVVPGADVALLVDTGFAEPDGDGAVMLPVVAAAVTGDG